MSPMFRVILAAAVVWVVPARATEPECGACAQRRKLADVATMVLFRHLEKSPLPPPKALSSMAARTEPLVFKLTVDDKGIPCEVVLVRSTDTRTADLLVSYVRKWRFRPPVYEGRTLCLRSLIFFYVRNVDERIHLIIPHLTDQGTSRIGKTAGM